MNFDPQFTFLLSYLLSLNPLANIKPFSLGESHVVALVIYPTYIIICQWPPINKCYVFIVNVRSWSSGKIFIQQVKDAVFFNEQNKTDTSVRTISQFLIKDHWPTAVVEGNFYIGIESLTRVNDFLCVFVDANATRMPSWLSIPLLVSEVVGS